MFLRQYFVIIWILLMIAPFAAAEETVIDKELTVIRGDYKEVHYLVPENSDPFDLQGSFKAKGGLNDDISFLVLPKDQYVRWYSNYPNKPIVKFEKKKEGTFRITTTPGETYYFVFDNFFSTVSNKQVKIQVKTVPPEKK
jgi:hypothetical protein